MTTELERPIQAEYEAVLNAPDRHERQAHLDRLVELNSMYERLYEEKLDLIANLRDTIVQIYSLYGEDERIAKLCNERLDDQRFT